MSKSPLGQFTVDRVVETQGPFAAVDFLLPQVDLARVDAAAPWLRPQYLSDDDRVVMSFHSYVLDTGRLLALLDRALDPREVSQKPRKALLECVGSQCCLT